MSPLREGRNVEVRGRVARIRYEAADGEFQVILVETESRTLVPTVVRGVAVQVGEQVAITGPVKRHRSGELQVHGEQVERVLPKTAAGIESYLASDAVKGIGPKLARDIVATFGDETMSVLDHAPERLREVAGVGEKRAAAIARHWETATAMREVMIFLQSRGISPAYAARIYKQYGGRAVRTVQEDPYVLARDIRGIGFRIADRIARLGGIAPQDPRRVRAGLEYVLRTALDDGHVMLPEDELRAGAEQLLEATSDQISRSIDELCSAGRIAPDVTRPAAPGYYLSAVLEDEEELGARLAALSGTAPRLPTPSVADMDRVQERLGFALAPGQRRALTELLGRGVAVLTGGPGTGKTTLVRAAVRFAASQKMRVVLAAPTGRAAKRLSESTGEDARTLHRTLGFDPRAGGFQRGEDDPIDADVIIVDEASMLDQSLALALARSLSPGTSLLLVGDVEQLPSVGAGDVLGDIIASGIAPVARLDVVFRQAGDSDIVSCAHAIRRGELPRPSTDPQGQFFFIEASEPERALDTVRRVVIERMPKAFGLSPITDIQCLTPMNTGPMGTRALNASLQSALGVGGPALSRGDRRLHAGDKVMQVRNNYDLDVFNGDIGVVAAIDVERVRASVEFDGRRVEYGPDQLDDLVLAYAVTVHKSQGSEFPAVVLVLTTHHFKLLQRNLVYTAMTRARERLVVVGSKRALRMAIDGVTDIDRHTRLTERLVALRARGSGRSGSTPGQ